MAVIIPLNNEGATSGSKITDALCVFTIFGSSSSHAFSAALPAISSSGSRSEKYLREQYSPPVLFCSPFSATTPTPIEHIDDLYVLEMPLELAMKISDSLSPNDEPEL